MKKIVGVLLAVCLVLTLMACASKPPASTGMPTNIATARRNAPEDVLVGLGNAHLSTVAQSRNLAATRARAEISNAMNSMISNMVRDYTASSEVDHSAALSFQENITVQLSRSNLSGAVIQVEDQDKEGNWWVVMYLSKTDVAKEISQAQAAAKLAVPAMASFDAERRMNEAFEQARREGW